MSRAKAQTIGTGVIASRMNVSSFTVRRWIHDGELDAINVGRKHQGRPTYRVLLASFESFVRRRGGSDDVVRALLTPV